MNEGKLPAKETALKTEVMVAAIWRAAAKTAADYRVWRAEDILNTIRAAEHVESMLRVTNQLWEHTEG